MSYDELKSERTAQGLAVASLAGLALHSRFDPLKEAERLAGSPEADGADLVLLFGFGLGYVAEALAARRADRPLLVIEPEADWPALALELRSGSSRPFSLPAGFRMSIISPDHPDGILAALQEAACRAPALILNPAQARLRPEAAQWCRTALDRYRQRTQVNSNTLTKFGRLWVRNLARNLESFAASPGIAGLSGSCRSFPGLLLAGGPSLDLVLPVLPALRERLVLVAVDTSLRACLAAGVDPDFVVMVDPQYWNTRHLDGCRHSRATVICESSVFPRALRLGQGPVRFCSSLFPLGRFFEQRLGTKGPLGAGGSVATSAWDFLRLLGAAPIFTAGLDLSFPGGHTHFRGSVFEEATHRESRRLRPAAMARYDYLTSGGSRSVPDDCGGLVLSDQRMDVYAQWFENQFRLHPGAVTRRIGSGSRQIEGLGSASLDDCLSLPVCRPAIDALLLPLARQAASPAAGPVPDGGRHKRLDEARRELTAQLHALEELATQALATIGGCVSGMDCPPAVLQRLDAIDAALAGYADNRIIGFLVENLIQDLSTAAPPADLAEALERSTRLYRGLAEACRYHLEYFADNGDKAPQAADGPADT